MPRGKKRKKASVREGDLDGTAILEEDNTITQDDVGGDITMSYDPASGSEFPIGETVVECTATTRDANLYTPGI